MVKRPVVSAFSVLLAAGGGASLAVAADSPTASNLRSLAAVYDHALQDTNGDGLADAITARIILPAQPTMHDVEAATNIAARLGYETTAATLPIVLREDQTPARLSNVLPILVGRDNKFVKALVARGALDLQSLKPGQGMVAVVMNAIGTSPAVVVIGGDDAGTASASVEIAARLPRVWNMTGVALSAIEGEALAYLKGRNVAADAVLVTAIVVDTNRQGIASVDLQVDVAGSEVERALAVLRDLDARHRFGDEVDTLDYSPISRLNFNVSAGSGAGGRAILHRTGPNWRALTSPPSSSPASGPARPNAALVGASANPPGRRRATSRSYHDGLGMGGGGATYGAAPSSQPAIAKAYDLADAYSIAGWFDDLYRDLAPDSTDTTIVVGGDPSEAMGAANIAARLGLETTGITLPIAKQDADVTRPQNEQSPILVGRGNKLVQALAANNKAQLSDLEAGDGLLQIVPQAFGNATATVVAGADAAGTAAASSLISRRLPYVWDVRPGAPTLQDVKNETLDFLNGRTAAGQAARALNELDKALANLTPPGAKPASIDAKVYLEDANPKLEAMIRDRIRAKTGVKASVTTLPITEKVLAFEDRMDVPWEVDDFWAKFDAQVLPLVKRGSAVTLQVRVSETPAIRRDIERQAAAKLAKAGASAVQVQVASAYKQGFFWLTEEVLPELKSKGAKSVHIKVRSANPDPAQNTSFHQVSARWIKALFPADEVYRRELGMAFSNFRIEQVEKADTTYSLEAFDAAGRVVFTSSFDPALVKREYLDVLPGQALLDVETGQLSATVDGTTVANARIVTDMEKVWDYYQAKVLPKLRDQLTRARPPAGAEQAPLFRDLKIDISISEPDYDIGEGEHISPVEGLAHDLYMVTGAFARAVGATANIRTIPVAQPGAQGPGVARFALDRNRSVAGRIEVTTTPAAGGPAAILSRALNPLDIAPPRATRIVARPDRLRRLDLEVAARDEPSASEAAAALRALADLHRAGFYRTSLSYEHLDQLVVTVQGTAQKQAVLLANAGDAMPSKALRAQKAPTAPVVAWDHIISPAESEQIVSKLSYFPQIAAYKAAKSYERRDISVMEITAPTTSELVSTAKLSAYKPTLMLVGRVHGNEPSSTSYMLKLAENLASDPSLDNIVKKVNLVILPVANPDGATLAGEIRKSRPMDIAQPGYTNPFSNVLAAGAGLSENEVDDYLWRRWLPDVYLNAHSASSHEVVQPFSGYTQTISPTYSFRRGWYSLSFQMPMDPRYPQWTEAALALRDAMAKEVSSVPEARAGNLRDYERFRRWGHRYAPHIEPYEIHKDTMLFYSDPDSGELMGSRRIEGPDAESAPRMSDWPFVTLDGGTFESADEGSADYSLRLGAQNGYSAVLAHLKYLRDGVYDVLRIEEDAPGEGAKLTTLRVRPVLPPKAGDK